MAPRRPPEIYRAPFPLYALRVHRSTGLALMAGGGGAAKTGIANGLHFLQLGWRGGQLSASLVHAHDTETRATMTLAVAGETIAAGQDAACHILRFRLSQAAAADGAAPSKAGGGGDDGGEKGPRKRRGPAPRGPDSTHNDTPEVVVETLHCVQTDTSPDALQKAVCFSDDHTLLATGGVDGFLRVWEFPSMKKAFEVQAHQGEIEDIALSPDNKVVTVGRDFQCCVWQRDQMVTVLHWNENLPGIPEKAYRYQACRFGTVEDQGKALRLYTIQIPYKRERRPPPCYITKWDGQSFLPLLTRPCGNEVVSCLSVSDTGTFLGLGTVTGSVSIFIAFSLQRLYYIREAHGIVVTAVAFLPETPELLRDNEAALLSVAVDSRCRLHCIPCRRTSREGGWWRRRLPCPLGGVAGAPLCWRKGPPPLTWTLFSPFSRERSRVAAAAPVRWADCGHCAAAAAGLPWLPVRPFPPIGMLARIRPFLGPSPGGPLRLRRAEGRMPAEGPGHGMGPRLHQSLTVDVAESLVLGPRGPVFVTLLGGTFQPRALGVGRHSPGPARDLQPGLKLEDGAMLFLAPSLPWWLRPGFRELRRAAVGAFGGGGWPLVLSLGSTELPTLFPHPSSSGSRAPPGREASAPWMSVLSSNPFLGVLDNTSHCP
ncbi:hypothetical protein JRQ81_005504 [Phrynocephalus forsythii]|uniref:Prolactin regulatory element-binding protein n=1 Tax=Phrynocephalus forsythii TaxID=171643 RepID=A0A9Q1B6V5_9SAUR|nr:hypothetical protein JRQ81_005504 [Phrynocephalus forsythii]